MLYIRIRDIPVAIISLVIAIPVIMWAMPLFDRLGVNWGFALFALIIVVSLIAGTFLWNQARRFVAYLDRSQR